MKYSEDLLFFVPLRNGSHSLLEGVRLADRSAWFGKACSLFPVPRAFAPQMGCQKTLASQADGAHGPERWFAGRKCSLYYEETGRLDWRKKSTDQKSFSRPEKGMDPEDFSLLLVLSSRLGEGDCGT